MSSFLIQIYRDCFNFSKKRDKLVDRSDNADKQWTDNETDPKNKGDELKKNGDEKSLSADSADDTPIINPVKWTVSLLFSFIYILILSH